MILRILEVEVVGPRQLRLAFNSGVEKCVDLTPVLEGTIFTPLHDAVYFSKVQLDPVCGTVVWPNGADLAPEALLALPALPLPVG